MSGKRKVIEEESEPWMTLTSKWSTVGLIQQKYNILCPHFISIEMLTSGYHEAIGWALRVRLSVTKLFLK